MKKTPIFAGILGALCAGFISLSPVYGQPTALDGDIDAYLIEQLNQKLQSERAEFEAQRKQIASDQEKIRVGLEELAAAQADLKERQDRLAAGEAALKQAQEAFENERYKCTEASPEQLAAKFREGYDNGLKACLCPKCPACPTCRNRP